MTNRIHVSVSILVRAQGQVLKPRGQSQGQVPGTSFPVSVQKHRSRPSTNSSTNITARELQHLVEELTLDISYLISWSTAQRPEDTAVPVA